MRLMVEIRVSRDEAGRIVPWCGFCRERPPYVRMQFKADEPMHTVGECPDCHEIYAEPKPEPPRQVIIIDAPLWN